LFICLRISLIS